MIKRVKQVVSLIGLFLRKTLFKVSITSLICAGFLWILHPNACLIVDLILAIICLWLPFGIKNKGGLATLKRLPFEKTDLSIVYAFVSFFELHYSLLIMKAASILKNYTVVSALYENKNLLELVRNPLFELKLEESGYLNYIYPFDNMGIFIIWNLLFMVSAILLSKGVGFEK